MKLHGIKLHNLFRYGDVNNVVELDQGARYFLDFPDKPVQWQLDERKIKAEEFLAKYGNDSQRRMFSIVGMTDGDPNRSNGSGKSSIPECVLYVLYEKVSREYASDPDAKGRSILSVVFEEAGVYRPESYGAVLLTAEGSLWYVKRGRKVSKNGDHSPVFHIECLASERETGSYSGQRKKADQKTLSQIVKYSYDTMCNSVMFGQKDGGKFVNGGDKEYKSIVMNALQLAILHEYLKEANERRRAVTREIGALASQLEVIESEANVDIDEMRTKLASCVEDQNKVDLEIAQVSAKIEDLNARISGAGVEKAKSAHQLAISVVDSKKKEEESKISGMKDKATAYTSQINAQNADLDDINARLGHLASDILRANTVILGFDQAKYDKEMALVQQARKYKPIRTASKDAAVSKRQDILSEIAVLKTAITELEMALRSFLLKKKSAEQGGVITCPDCESQVGVAHIDKKIEDKTALLATNRAKLEDLSSQKIVIDSEIKDLEEKLKKIETCIAGETALSVAKAGFDNATANRVKAEADVVVLTIKKAYVVSFISKVKAEAKENEAQLVRCQSETAAVLQPFADEVAAAKKAIDTAQEVATAAKLEADVQKKLLASLNDKRTAFVRDSGMLSEKIARAEEAKKQYLEIGNLKTIKSKEEDRLKLVEEKMGVDGIQVRILHRYLPLLNSYIAEYLGIISGHKMEAKIDYNNEKDEFELMVSGASSSRPYMLSGGEGIKVRLAVDIALSLLCFARSTEVPEFIFLDEVLSPLDEDTKKNVFELIMNKLHEHFKSILVISHDPIVQEKIPHTIVVDKVNGVSQISKQWFDV